MSKQTLRNAVRRIWPCVVVIAGVALAAGLALIAAGGQGALAAPGVIYVDADATGANDGSSWDDAYTDLQDALASAVSGDEIWVAAGTYKPTSGTDRTASFQMKNGVEIYGGFDPGAGALRFADRDWDLYKTILSGDIGAAGDRSDNAYHVFYHPDGTNLDSSAILDGFIVRGGNANSVWPHRGGGGMYNVGSSPTLTNCAFRGNKASSYGGGMYNDDSSPTLTDCTFLGNSANGGGGMFNRSSSPTLSNCSFDSNEVTFAGGGMLNVVSSTTLTGCTFTGNSARYYGGGISNRPSSPTLTGCTLSGNSAYEGGGMHNEAWSSPTLTNCILSGNSATYGGGMSNVESSSPTLTNCTFGGNEASSAGGGMFNVYESSPALTGCTFSGNSARYSGGGMFNGGSSPTLTNCTFWGNEASSRGGGIDNEQSSPVLINCILWADTPDEISRPTAFPEVNSSPVVTYSVVQGGFPGRRNIDADPLFVDPANGDYHLQSGSPCIDAGDNTAPDLPDYDFEGDDRILDGDANGESVVDMGVDEFILSLVEVQIDITPSTVSNVIELGPGADVPMAILTTGEFDAADVDPSTVVFAGARQRDWSLADVDGDGDDDLLLTFDPRHLELDVDDREAILTGETFDGVPIEGTDKVKVKE